ncbi:MAG: LicD family protein [Clostridia bacterium]|nr:LicD family protein [Clostridia bacterium]
MLKQFVVVCEKLNLTYYLLGGTLLGAVRHKGFIPWDDDIDVGMPREDYEIFIKDAQQHLEKNISYRLFIRTLNSLLIFVKFEIVKLHSLKNRLKIVELIMGYILTYSPWMYILIQKDNINIFN